MSQSSQPPPSARQARGELHLRHEPRPDDRHSVRRIVTATGVFRREEIDVAVELIDERLTKCAASGYEFVFADRGGQTIGYACYGRIACTIGSYDLYWLAVLPQAQRGGVGRRLLAEVESELSRQSARRLYIETSSGPRYAATRAFYESRGYLAAATLADYYAPGDAKVIYEKTLTSLSADPPNECSVGEPCRDSRKLYDGLRS